MGCRWREKGTESRTTVFEAGQIRGKGIRKLQCGCSGCRGRKGKEKLVVV